LKEQKASRVWEWAKVLLIGAILAPGERTVAAILRVMGQQDEKQFQNYHRVQSLSEMVEPRDKPHPAAVARLLVCEGPRPSCGGDRRNNRASPRRADLSSWDLSRPSPLEQKSGGKNQWVALDLDDASDANSLGQARMGLAVFDGARPVGTLS
jgi:hypothetical protein